MALALCSCKLQLLASQRRQRRSSSAARCSSGATSSVQAAHEAIQYGAALTLDIRSSREFEREHLTKPPKRCVGVAWTGDADVEKWTSAAEKALGPAAKRGRVFIMSAEGGTEAEEAARALAAAGFGEVSVVAGGWTEWRKHYTSTLRATPPPGRWVPTGQEALKSGLMSGDAAMSYEGAARHRIRVAHPL